MSALTDLVLQQVKASAGKVEVPSNVKDTVLNGLSDSIIGSLTQTATKAGGIDMVKNLLTGKSDAASSPVTALAGKLFAGNVLSKLNLGASTGNALTGLIPVIFTKLGGCLKDQGGDGDVDFQDIIIALTGKGKPAAGGSSILSAATGILGGILKKN